MLKNIFKVRYAILKSESLNSYLMLKPRGPNFLLSWMIAWKNERVNASLCHYLFFFSHCFRKSSFISINDFFKFAFIPLGGYKVSFDPFCKIGTGK